MKYGKPPLSYDDQLILLTVRGLECPDRNRALEWLKRIGYYRLSAYFLPFRALGSGDFQVGVTLSHIVDLYKFDCNLRLLILQALDRVEVSIGAIVTHYLAHDLGAFGYADQTNFDSGYDHAGMMKILAREEQKSTEVFVRHYRGKYTSESYLPVWMATELLTFGALSKMYGNLRTNLRKKIAQEFGLPEAVFSSWLHALAAIRNVCAHHNRVWNRELAVKPKLPTVWKTAGLSNNRLYVIVLIIQFLLAATSANSKWKDRLKAHFSAYPSVDLKAMQFPPGWQCERPWL